MKKKKISILGDSISTFHGVTPEGGAFYGSWNSYETGVASVEDTWWMKVIHGLNGCLGRNNSLAGSLVSGHALTSGTSAKRIEDLGSNGAPDVILVAIGANDWGFRVLPEEFEAEYKRMVAALKYGYPHADIWCSTLPEGRTSYRGELLFSDVDGCISKKVYSDIICRTAKEAYIHIADLYGSGAQYTSIDGVHPDKGGMKLLADLWISEMKNEGDYK